MQSGQHRDELLVEPGGYMNAKPSKRVLFIWGVRSFVLTVCAKPASVQQRLERARQVDRSVCQTTSGQEQLGMFGIADVLSSLEVQFDSMLTD